MKKLHHHLFSSLHATALLVLSLTTVAQAQENETDRSPQWFIDVTEDGFWDSHYVRGLGVFVGRTSEVKKIIDLAASTGSNPQLGVGSEDGKQIFSTLEHPLISVELQKDFNDAPRDPIPATLSWAKDLKSGESETDYTVDAALTLNLYLPTDSPVLGYDPYELAHHLSFGIDFDRVDTDAGREEIVKYRVESELLPGQALFDTVAEPDIWRIGAEYRDDLMTGTGSWALDLSYIPVFRLYPFFEQTEENGLFLGRRSYWEKQRFFTEFAKRAISRGEIDPEIAPPTYLNITPILTLETADTSMLTSRGFDDQTHFAKAEISASLALFSEILTLQYVGTGMFPLDGSNDNYYFQSAVLTFDPNPITPLNVKLSYVTGEEAPTFTDREIISLTMGTTF